MTFVNAEQPKYESLSNKYSDVVFLAVGGTEKLAIAEES